MKVAFMKISLAQFLLIAGGFIACSVANVNLYAATAPKVVPVPEPTIDQRIDFYRTKLEQHPTLFVVYTQLAAAYLDKAREDLDPKWVKLAEQSLEKSQKIFSNYDAYKGLEVLNAYRHQFAEARRWGEIAYKIAPDDYEVLAVLVEADLGLGEIETAIKRLPPLNSEPEQFHIAVAMANVYKARHQYVEARKLFLLAEQLASAQGYPYLVVWARTNAAGMLIDSGQAQAALPDLQAAAKLRKGDAILRLHWSEYHAGIGEPQKALSILESMLEDSKHPSFHYRAYLLAKKLGHADKAKAHYAAAEKGYLRPLAEGEIYTLGSLALLYCEANTQLNQALELAQRNLQYKRDDEAQDALKCVQGKLAVKTKQKTRTSTQGKP